MHNGGFRRVIEDDFKKIPELLNASANMPLQSESNVDQQLSMFSEDSKNVQ